MKIEAGKTKIGVIGAGTMGAGIALTALYQGFEVVLYDLHPQALEVGEAYTRKFLAKKGLEKNLDLLTLTGELEGLAGAKFVIEVAIEDLDLKKALFAKLDEICPPPAILATNTSTLSVTAIASATSTPERVVGMHFFNPAPVVQLVEVIRGAMTSDETVDTVVSLAEDLGKQPVVTRDTPGFIVNRVARPFYGEALRLLGEGVASLEEIDMLVEKGAGFKMGPFRLMDLIGIDINAGAMQSMYEQTFGEARYKPHWIQMQKVAQGTLGRKTGKGFYEYDEEDQVAGKQGNNPIRKPVTQATSQQGMLVLVSEGSWGPGIRELCEKADYQVQSVVAGDEQMAACMIVTGREENLQKLVSRYDQDFLPEVPILVQAADVTVGKIATWMKHPQRLAGFDGLFFAGGQAVTLVESPVMDEKVKQMATAFVESLGRLPVWIKDCPAMALPRIVCQLVNEAAFAILEGVGEVQVIDKAMRLGVNYPKGPLEWGKEIGYRRVVMVLDHLWAEYHEERYRACRLLRSWARLDELDG